jgi:hypothetical protein
MSIITGIARALGFSKPAIKPPGKPALTPEQTAERLAWLQTPQYQALRRATFDRMNIRVENAEPPNGPGDHDWLRSGQGR